MSIIPQSVIDDWRAQYAEGADLWLQYPEIDRDEFLALAKRDENLLIEMFLNPAERPTDRSPVYLAEAGPPLSGKTTLGEQWANANPQRYGQAAQIDPDRKGLKFMMHAYQGYLTADRMVANAPDFPSAQQRAYNIARPASNYVTLEMLNTAGEAGFNIRHSTTMTSPHVGSLLGNVKDLGYDIDLLLCWSPDDVRAEAARYRASEQANYQTTPEDVVNKGIVFPQRFGNYFAQGNNVGLFWRDSFTSNARLAAFYSGGEETIYDENAFRAFQDQYQRSQIELAHASEADRIVLPDFNYHRETYLERSDHTAAIIVPDGPFRS